MSRNNSSSHRAEADFLGQYIQSERKAERKHHKGGNVGNFLGTTDNDLRATRYLTHHAEKRMAERGVIAKDAIKATKKSGAVIASNGAIVTVVPEAWVAAKRKKDRMIKSMQNSKPGQHIQSAASPIPFENLPHGQTHKRIDVPAGETRGHIIGKGGKNLSKLKQEHPGANIELNSNTGVMHVWGDANQVSSVCTQVKATINKIEKEKGRKIAEEGKTKEKIKNMQREEIIKMRKQQKENSKKRQQKEKMKEKNMNKQQKEKSEERQQKMKSKETTKRRNKERDKKSRYR